jgi:hypothetical protein
MPLSDESGYMSKDNFFNGYRAKLVLFDNQIESFFDKRI